MRLRILESVDDLDFTKEIHPSGEQLVTVIACDAGHLAAEGVAVVLTLARANRKAAELTLMGLQNPGYPENPEGLAWYWSRDRQELWLKGGTSGNTQPVKAVYRDCDGDALIYAVAPNGPACHTGARSCFEIPPTSSELPQRTGLSEVISTVGLLVPNSTLGSACQNMETKYGSNWQDEAFS